MYFGNLLSNLPFSYFRQSRMTLKFRMTLFPFNVGCNLFNRLEIAFFQKGSDSIGYSPGQVEVLK